jgi:hypothetical protein
MNTLNSKTRVVNINSESYDVLICRPSEWGNPYTHLKDRKTLAKYVVKNRKEAIESYRAWILKQPHLMEKLHTLKGKRLGCYCFPKSCHGDVLVELVEALEAPKYSSLF